MTIRPRHPLAPVRAGSRAGVTMLLENDLYPRDGRVRNEAEALVRAGYAVEVVAPRGSGQARRETVNGVDVRRFRAIDGSRHGAIGFLAEYALAIVALHRAALRALARGTAILHLHNPPDLCFPAAALFRLAGRAVVFDHHDLTPEVIEAKLGSGALVHLARLCERLTFACATHVLATNDSYAEIAVGRGHKRATDVTVVRNGPPNSWTRRPIHTRVGTLERVGLAYVGSISTQDGVEGLAPVLAGLRQLDPPLGVRLTIIGDGDARPRLESEFARYGVEDFVNFTGWVPVERVPELLAPADVCVDPAPATELNERSTMIKLAEYLALGKPVVAYDLVESRRTAAGAALLIPPGDVDGFTRAIAQLARDPQMRDHLARVARRRALELTWEHSERRLIAAYAALRQRR